MNNLQTFAKLHQNTINVLQGMARWQPSAGDYKYSAQTSDAGGWLICDGRWVDKVVFAELYSVIGESFGGSEGLFKLPDFRGRVPGAVGEGLGLSDRMMGDYVGAETHVLLVHELPAHNHTGTTDATTVALNNATNVVHANGSGDNIDVSGAGGIPSGNDVSTITAAAHTHPFTTNMTGGGDAHNTMQPTLFAGNMMIYAGSLDEVPQYE